MFGEKNNACSSSLRLAESSQESEANLHVESVAGMCLRLVVKPALNIC